jgi:hypothetical protein
MKNNYGNYVVQKALKVAKNGNKKRLMDCVVKNTDRLGEKKLIERWKTIVSEISEKSTYTPFTKKTSNIIKNNLSYSQCSNQSLSPLMNQDRSIDMNNEKINQNKKYSLFNPKKPNNECK